MKSVKLFIGRVTLTLVFIYIAMVVSAPDANEVNIAILQYTIWDKMTFFQVISWFQKTRLFFCKYSITYLKKKMVKKITVIDIYILLNGGISLYMYIKFR